MFRPVRWAVWLQTLVCLDGINSCYRHTPEDIFQVTCGHFTDGVVATNASPSVIVATKTGIFSQKTPDRPAFVPKPEQSREIENSFLNGLSVSVVASLQPDT